MNWRSSFILLIAIISNAFSCPKNCQSCGATGFSCAMCVPGFKLSNTFGEVTCIECSQEGCSICPNYQDFFSEKCSGCKSGYYITGKSPDILCKPCISNCDSCVNSTECIRCSDSAKSTSDKKCESKNTSNVGLIVGLAVGLPLLLIIIVCVVCQARKRPNLANNSSSNVTFSSTPINSVQPLQHPNSQPYFANQLQQGNLGAPNDQMMFQQPFTNQMAPHQGMNQMNAGFQPNLYNSANQGTIPVGLPVQPYQINQQYNDQNKITPFQPRF